MGRVNTPEYEVNHIGHPWEGVKEGAPCHEASENKERVHEDLWHLHDPRNPGVGIKDAAR